MSERYELNITSPSYFDGIDESEVVFHALNKSGSMALENVMREAFDYAGRSDEFLSHYKIGGRIESFCKLVSKKKSKFVVAHYLYGALKPRKRRIWITQFRHPLPKFLSTYNWIKIKTEKKSGKPFMSLKKFALNPKLIKHNLIYQFGAEWEKFKNHGESAPTAKSLYEASLVALETHVHSLTLAERFEESLFLVARLCGLSSLAPWIRDNRNPGRKLSHEISAEEREIIDQALYYDYQLYNYAVNRFERQIMQIDFGDNLENYKQVCLNQYKDRLLV